VLTSTKNLDRRWLWSLVYGTVIGLTAFVFLLRWAGFDNVWIQIGHLHFGYLAAYVGLTIGTYYLRAWRFQLLIGGRGIISKLYGVVSVHNLMVNLLPLSSGELSYPFLLKRCGISSRFFDGIPSLILARFQDLIISCVLLIAALASIGHFIALGEAVVGTLVKTIAFSFLIVATGFLLWRKLAEKSLLPARIRSSVVEVMGSVARVGTAVWIGSFSIAVITRFTSIIATFYLIQAVGIFLSFPVVFLICNAYVFLPLLPINTLAGLGITEAFLVMFFVASGIDRQIAAVASIHVHLLQLMIAATLGGIGALQLRYRTQGKAEFSIS
jgi:glycosyltransferase 2 family protein